MSPFIARKARPEREKTKTEEKAPEIPRIRAKSYMDKFINPPDYMEEQKRKMERERGPAEEEPRRAGARRADVPATERAARAVGARHPGDRARRGLLLRAPAPDQDPERGLGRLLAQQDHDGAGAEGQRDHRLRRPQRGRAGDGARPVQPVQDRHRAAARHRGALGQGALRARVERVPEPRSAAGWDKRLGLGRKKIFEVRKLYNDVTFIDEFFTADFCERNKFFSFSLNDRSGNYEIDSREFEKIKHKMLFQLTNFGDPFIFVEDSNHDNRGELLMRHRHEGTDLQIDHARATLTALVRIWRRPVNLLTSVEGKQKLFRYDGKEQVEKSIGN
jgi:stage V sporulation protein R